MPSLDFDGDYGRSYRQSSGAEPGQRCPAGAGGGVLLLSAYSEAEDGESQREVFDVAWQRLVDRGVPQETLEKIKDSRNKEVFSLDAAGSRLR